MLKVAQRTECVYTEDSGLLSCHGPNLIVECATRLFWSESSVFQMDVIAKCNGSEKMFRIIPRKLDNSAWFDNSLFLQLSGQKEVDGLRVSDKECYAKLNELLEDSVRNEKVYLEKETVYMIGKHWWHSIICLK